MSQGWQSDLVTAARAARLRAYAPYSHYLVGAALLTHAGRIFTGCNVENASYGATVCAERVALWKAISEGERDFAAIAVVTINGGSPCGVCRQVMAEFAPGMTVIVADLKGQARIAMVQDLLPDRFHPEDIVIE
jgi:cytidine deaminase